MCELKAILLDNGVMYVTVYNEKDKTTSLWSSKDGVEWTEKARRGEARGETNGT